MSAIKQANRNTLFIVDRVSDSSKVLQSSQFQIISTSFFSDKAILQEVVNDIAIAILRFLFGRCRGIR